MLAAGAAKRFGGKKQLATLGNSTLLEQSIAQHQISVLDNFYVVLGAHGREISEKLTEVEGIKLLIAENWEQGLGHSIASGVSQLLNEPASHLLLCLGDQIAVTDEDIKTLIDASKNNPDAIVASAYQNQLGVPAIFPKWAWPELAKLKGDKGAKSLFYQLQEEVVSVPLDNPEIDIDTPADLAKWRSQNNV